ncbi:MAG: D-alanyl-D-alanine carboxypeptidase [Alphaproteobacteria bacterium]|nr:D-alanyl-D-alanine carboxypeptidase [Alphaproteobacteria bacterium]
MNPTVLRTAVVALNATLAIGVLTAVWPSSTPAKSQPPMPLVQVLPEIPADVWTPPTWFPEATEDRLWVLEDLDGDGLDGRGPKLRASSAIIADLDRGEILWAKDADSPRSIASLTKMFAALALVSHEDVDLDREVCLGPEQWPSRPGGRSKFSTGDCHAGWEYLGGALVASDNRGAFSLPAVADAEFYTFVDRMDEVASDLRARSASFSDPAGLEDENRASARDVLKAVVAVSAHPTLAPVASAPWWTLDEGRGQRRINTTNRLVDAYETLAAKTGYTDTARYCFATVVRTASGRTLASVVLGAPTSGSRFTDTRALLTWADQH